MVAGVREIENCFVIGLRVDRHGDGTGLSRV
ncbi:MAG: hypothetical protein QOJ56_3685 [Mycobacterium sp.]|jgi:hypothetical protein|nr:hypothetical protein [Mycobacterium sp.]